jgi:glycosyl transferase family 2
MNDIPRVSIITPAYNAAGTIEETLKSVLAQSYPHWEQIVVDDGSGDGTGRIVSNFLSLNSRIRMIRQSQSGEAAARNAGLKEAQHEWLLFLDADDWIAPLYLQRMTNLLTSNASPDAVICRSARVALDGAVVVEEDNLPEGDLFPILARYPPFHVHACVVRKSIVDAVGRFDTSIERCPDWDLWQRVARSGVRFAALDEVLAYYRMSPKGVSLDAEKMLRDSLLILRRGHAPDARVPNPCARYVAGMPADQIVTQEFYLLSWCAGLLLGSGKDAQALLNMVTGDPYPELWPPSVAQCILEAAPLPACKAPYQLQDLVPALMEHLDEFLFALEKHSGAPDLARRTRDEILKKIDWPVA